MEKESKRQCTSSSDLISTHLIGPSDEISGFQVKHCSTSIINELDSKQSLSVYVPISKRKRVAFRWDEKAVSKSHYFFSYLDVSICCFLNKAYNNY